MELAATLIPRIAVIALTGPVRSRPRITKVEKTYIMPAAAALAIAAMVVEDDDWAHVHDQESTAGERDDPSLRVPISYACVSKWALG